MDEVPGHRNLACGLYAICLNVVVKRQWVSFTCRSCSLWPHGEQACQDTGPAQVIPLPHIAGR